MDSPSAQLAEASIIDFGGPPSSPFITEIDNNNINNSQSPSKQWRQSIHSLPAEDNNTQSPTKQAMYAVDEDKENIAQDEATSTLNKLFATPEHSRSTTTPLKSSQDANLMPPPSISRAQSSSTKTPRSSTRSRATTPRSSSRASITSRTPQQNAAAFQAGLNVRSAMMPQEDQPQQIDDTCFSTFSEIPDMAVFASLRQSPTKHLDLLRTPRQDGERTPHTSRKRSMESRSPSPTPRRQKTPATAVSRREDTGSFLIDFTQQLEGIANHSSTSPAKSQTESNLLQYINNNRTPNKPHSTSRGANYTTPNKSKVLNLLDFELPPAPTPRSIPTITVRELESLKSSYLSQISSLKATLSGREAEVDSLKKAVGDAERRVGLAQEALREERSKREYLETESESWKKRGSEFETVLKNVKEEVLKSEAEKEDTLRRLEDTERRVQEAETRAVKAEERFADALAARANGAEGSDSIAMEEQVQRLVTVQIDAKIEAVSRELHAVYKDKHERKVSTLKKSYEARSEKKTADLQARVAELEENNEDLQAAKDVTFSGPIRNNADNTAELKAQIEEQNAALARLESEMQVSRTHQEALELELKQERIEKGDLVAAVDEMLALQAEGPPPATPLGKRAVSVVEDFRRSIARPAASGGSGIPGVPSGLRGPAPVLSRSGSGGAGKSRMLANIERMGRSGSANGNSAGGGMEM